MKSLSLALLGLVLINIPACFSAECFSQSLKPSYPCCKGDKVVYTDEDGDWGVEDGKWCGIGNGSSSIEDDSCFAIALGYSCCNHCDIFYTDDEGREWGKENGKWCGIKISCNVPIPDQEPVKELVKEPVKEPIQSDSDFDFTFLKLKNNKENMLYSPLSIRYALNMLQEGAVNNTFTEINRLIGNDELPVYSSIDEVLSFANGLFIRDYYYDLVEAGYIETLKEKYDAEVKKDAFKDAKNVNQWIEEKTLGIIKDMLEDEIVQDPFNVMLIINALAIDMGWASPFSDNSTHGEDFILDNGEEMTATMMSKKEYGENLAYYKDDDVTAITMDLKEYEGTQLEFMAIMPNGTLSDFVENITKEQITKIDNDLTLAKDVKDGVVLRIPKFKFNNKFSLKKELKALGVIDAFDEEKADFTKMADPEDPKDRLHVSDVLHKADIEFSEDGIKAAAVTVIIMAIGTSMPVPTEPVIIVMNKPFMFIIRDKNTKDIWFTGTVYQPNSWEDDKAEYEPSNEYGFY